MAENISNIKDRIGNIQTDVLFEKLLCHFPDNDNIIYEPKGVFNRGILKDIERVLSKKKHLFVEVNRPGIYDVLPKGLFHNKVDDRNNSDAFFEQVEVEKKDARKFFLPFDSEMFSGFTQIERIAINHHKHAYDSDILISFINFFHLQDEIDFLSLLELLAIDLVSFLAISNINEDLIYRRLTNILHQEITPYELLKNLIGQTQGNSMITRLMKVIPFASASAGKIQEIKEILEFIIRLKVTTKQIREVKRYSTDHGCSNSTLDTTMNVSTHSMIIGNTYLDEVDTVNISIEIEPDKMFLMSNLMNGSISKLIQAFLSFFIDFHTEPKITFRVGTDSNAKQFSNFHLNKAPGETYTKMQTLKFKLTQHFKDLDFQGQSFQSGIPVSTILLLKEYFISFTKLISERKNHYAYLNMNTKV